MKRSGLGGALKDRADFIRRGQRVQSQAITGLDEQVAARNVPVRFVTQQASRLATALGADAQATIQMYVGPQADLRPGWLVRPRSNRQIAYSVVSVTPYPSPHSVEFMVATLRLDATTLSEVRL